MRATTDVNELLRQAVNAARAGRELTARDLFLDVVKLDPYNKLAWYWLIGLLDDLDDRIEACRRVLALDPLNRETLAMLERLESERKAWQKQKHEETLRDLNEIASLLKTDPETALPLLRQTAREHANMERVWLMLAEAAPSIDEQTAALSNAVGLNPANQAAADQLKSLLALQNDPYDLARYYEERGDRESALGTYKRIALESKSREDWDLIYSNITRLERLQHENIQHVSPTLSLIRLTAGPPVLYFVSLMVHYGFAPQYAPLPMWFAFLVCVGGSFLTAFASLRVHHRIWDFLGEPGTSGSSLSRFSLRAAGVTLIIVSFLPLLMDALIRLTNFVPPLPPF